MPSLLYRDRCGAEGAATCQRFVNAPAAASIPTLSVVPTAFSYVIDFGRVTRDVLLGVLCGTTVGLFAAMVCPCF